MQSVGISLHKWCIVAVLKRGLNQDTRLAFSEWCPAIRQPHVPLYIQESYTVQLSSNSTYCMVWQLYVLLYFTQTCCPVRLQNTLAYQWKDKNGLLCSASIAFSDPVRIFICAWEHVPDRRHCSCHALSPLNAQCTGVKRVKSPLGWLCRVLCVSHQEAPRSRVLHFIEPQFLKRFCSLFTDKDITCIWPCHTKAGWLGQEALPACFFDVWQQLLCNPSRLNVEETALHL